MKLGAKERENMVYVKSDGKEKKPRIKFEGRLCGLSTDAAAVVSKERGQYKYIDLGFAAQNGGEWINVRVSAKENETISLDEDATLAQLKRADELLKEKKRPLVSLEYYESVKIPLDENKQPILKDGKPIVYVNKKSSMDDIRRTFKILKEDTGVAGGQTSQLEAFV